MRILTRYTLKSILLVFFISLLIFSLLVMAVETFMHLDSFITGDLGLAEMLRYALSSLSSYIMMLIALSSLFSITYFLSSMSANNELISLYTAGLSKVRILRPIIILSLLMTVFFFFVNESLVLEWKNYKDVVSQEYFGMSSTFDASNTVLYDEESGYLIYADRYSDSNKRLYSPLLIKSEDENIRERIEADYADYVNDGWHFYNARVTLVQNNNLESFTEREYLDEDFNIPDDMFRRQNLQLETMELDYAYEYLNRLKSVNYASWREGMTDFLRRLASPFGILVLSFIALSLNYTYKKNILLFSIVQSLIIAVVYYVADMVFSIAARQGSINVYSVFIAPPIITVALSYLISHLGKRI